MLSGYVALKGCVCAGFVSTDLTCELCSGSGGVGNMGGEDRPGGGGGRGGGGREGGGDLICGLCSRSWGVGTMRGGDGGGGGEGGGGVLCHSLDLTCIIYSNCF